MAQLKTVSARLLQGGVLWKLKGQDGEFSKPVPGNRS
jgi:hypothetical protein